MKKLIPVLLLVVSTTARAQSWQDTVKTIEVLFSRYHPDAPG
jgi:hypothetical protein